LSVSSSLAVYEDFLRGSSERLDSPPSRSSSLIFDDDDDEDDDEDDARGKALPKTEGSSANTWAFFWLRVPACKDAVGIKEEEEDDENNGEEEDENFENDDDDEEEEEEDEEEDEDGDLDL